MILQIIFIAQKKSVYLLLDIARLSAAPQWLAINSGAVNRRQSRQWTSRPTSRHLLRLFPFPTFPLFLSLLSLELFLYRLSRVSPIIPSQFSPYSQLILTFCTNLIVFFCYYYYYYRPLSSPRPLAICCPLVSRQLKNSFLGERFLNQIFDSAIH